MARPSPAGPQRGILTQKPRLMAGASFLWVWAGELTQGGLYRATVIGSFS
jgi:hypothetical protein